MIIILWIKNNKYKKNLDLNGYLFLEIKMNLWNFYILNISNTLFQKNKNKVKKNLKKKNQKYYLTFINYQTNEHIIR